jgi:hypothetical protein
VNTEEEAKAKTCPIGKARGSFDDNWDRGPCIASQCMAWRFFQMDGYIMKKDQKWYAGGPSHDSVGYCGLAGKP